MATTTASAGRVLLMNQGTWTTGTAYEVLDFVYYNGSTYVCKEDLTSTTAPNLDTDHWQVMAYGFDSTALDELTAMITPDGTFSCTIDGTTYTNAQDAIDAVNALFAERPPIGDEWDADTSYTEGQYAIYNNTLYKALTTVPAGTLVTDTTYWESTTVTNELESHATDIATNATNIATNASDISTLNSDLCASNAGAHNSIYRGKYLGTSVTDDQFTAISDGTFDDLYIGDYWTINSVNYRIAAFDYYYLTGDTSFTDHHVVIVPDGQLYSAQMNTSNTTEGAYYNSAMKQSNLDTAVTTIETAFGEAHVLSHRNYLQNAVSSGIPSAGTWCDTKVDLMTEQNVYGCKIFASVSDGSTVPANYVIDKSQYPLFMLNPYMISLNRAGYWLREVVTTDYFAAVGNAGYANIDYASDSIGVRPAFCIG